MRKKTCPVCDKVFEYVQRSNKERKYCSRQCAGKNNRNRIKKECIVCGATFEVWPSSAARRITCSKQCNIEWQKTSQLGVNNGNWKGGKNKYECKHCGKKFLDNSYQKNRDYCSDECHNKSMIGVDQKTQEKRPRITKNCKGCGDRFVLNYSRKDRKFCSKKCWNEYAQGENHPTWDGGKELKICINCKKEYKVIPARSDVSKFCSYRCRDEYNNVKVYCEWCGEIIKKPKSREHYNNHFCGDRHRLLWLNKENRSPTQAEIKMAEILNSLGVEHEEQYSFGPYLLDFAIKEKQIDLEVDSEYHHNLPGRPEKDAKRDAYMMENGWKVIRIPSGKVHYDPDTCKRIIRKNIG